MHARSRFQALNVALGTAVLLGISGVGCATRYDVNVDAIHNPNVAPNGFSYRIEAFDPAKSTSDPHFEQVVSLVRAALSSRGMYEAPEGMQPDVIIDLDYGVGPVQSRLVRSPSAELGTTQQVDPVTGRAVRVPSSRQGSMGPRPVFTTGGGYREEYVFEKFLTIVGRDGRTNPAAGEPRIELWRVHVSVEDNGDDISNYLTVLAAAATDYIGTDTRQKQRVKVSENDEIVDFVKQGL